MCEPMGAEKTPKVGEPPSYVAGTDNFYAVTHYNWSSCYAMTVIDLGQAVTLWIQLRFRLQA